MRPVEIGELDYPHALKLGGSGMRILFLSPRYPYPPRRGDQVRAFHLAKGLAEHAEVTLLSFGDGPNPQTDGLVLRSIKPTLTGRVSGNALAPNPALPLQTRMFAHSGMRRAVREELAKTPDVVHVTLSRMGPYLPKPKPGLHRHLDLVDSLSINMRTRGEVSGGPSGAVFRAEARLLARYEARLAASADSVSLVSAADRRAPGLEAADVIPNGIDTEGIAYTDRPDDAPPVLTFFGNLGYFHNAEPARFVAEEVLPRIRAEVPEASLRLAGARPSATVRALERLDGVEVHADVPDMAAELSESTVALLPMFTGSGLKNKVLEAFASGLPVVANAMGMDGVEGAKDGRHFVSAADADSFARAAIALLGEPARRRDIALAARTLIEDLYSWEHQVNRLLALYSAS